MYTTSTAFLEALRDGGVRYAFANLGSDHPGIIEAYARARADGTTHRFPELVICPHESVALSAAQGYAQVTGEPQAVILHVDCGTQNVGGMLHNAARARVPVLLFAGASPVTQEGRNEFIHWLQDVHDQRGIVRGYTKYDNEIRTGHNVKQLVGRALQIARSEPAGPVYLMCAREVLQQPLEPVASTPAVPVAPAALTTDVAAQIAGALAAARDPLVVTSYLGRDPYSVPALVELCERLAIPVLESTPMHLNFPATHPLHAGYQWTTTSQNPLLAKADTVLVLGSDVPWIPSNNRPAPDARIFVVDIDPLKEQLPLWDVPAELYARADLATAVRQITGHLPTTGTAVEQRRIALAAEHEQRAAELGERERPHGDVITPEYLVACVREAIDDDTIVLSEAITHYQTVNEHLRRDVLGTLICSGGSSLGWHAGASIGAKLAAPDRTVVSLVGDGTYLFGVPSSAQWVARRYGTPSLTVILDNQGWRAPKLSTLGVYPDGVAATNDDFGVSFTPEADLSGIATAAGAAWGRTVRDPDELPAALKEAMDVVRGGRSAVLAAHIPPVSP